MHRLARYITAAVVALVSIAGAGAQDTTVSHALTLLDTPKYGPDFKHFDYVNPDALAGGNVRLSALGTFDSLNPYIIKGVSAAGLGGVFETLTLQPEDELSTEYGLIAESVEVPADNSWVMFTLRPEARFHDGSPITVEDVIFSFDILKSKGNPLYRSYYANVIKAEEVGARKVKFSFSEGDNRELPHIVGQLPVLSKAYWTTHDFEKTTLEPPLGSGPYKVASVNPGRSITYRRVDDYWGKDLPVRVGLNNFGTIRFDYYRDGTVALEAFKAGEYDFRSENVAKNWASAYSGPALKKGLFKMEKLPHERPTGMQAFMYNTRRAVFKDPRVRQALTYAFDFEWTNKNLFYGGYTRTASFFSNSELAAQGLPSEQELAILERFRGRIPDEVFTEEYRPPTTGGDGSIRRNLRAAAKLLKEAGWVVKGKQLVNSTTGKPMQFELMLVQPTFERIALPFKRNLQRLGVEFRVRTVDVAQYQKRIDDFDFDMVTTVLPQSISPGNEQRDFWSSQEADVPGSRNLAGIKDPVVDELVDLIIAAPDRESLIYRTRALDRVLLWGHYAIPAWHLRFDRVAYWDKFRRPEVKPTYGVGFGSWWVDTGKAATTEKLKTEITTQ